MADVAWFDRTQVLSAIAGDNPNLRIPGPGAIAHHLIKAWANA
jgi:NADH pyrophosphatase NudC (nudix superfamily)